VPCSHLSLMFALTSVTVKVVHSNIYKLCTILSHAAQSLCDHHTLSCNHTHGNLMGSDPVTMVANSVHLHDQSISLGIYDSNTAWQPDWNEAALHQAGSTSVVFVEEHSVRMLAVHLTKNWRKYHLSDVAGKYNELVTNDTTPHVYRKVMLVVAFNSSVWIITIP